MPSLGVRVISVLRVQYAVAFLPPHAIETTVALFLTPDIVNGRNAAKLRCKQDVYLFLVGWCVGKHLSRILRGNVSKC